MKKILIVLLALLLLMGCTNKNDANNTISTNNNANNTNNTNNSNNSNNSNNNNSNNTGNNGNNGENNDKDNKHVIVPFASKEDMLSKMTGYWYMPEYELLKDITDNYDYSSSLDIREDGTVEFVLAGIKGYIMEPELRINFEKGDKLKEFGNDQWYFTLSGSMSQAGNEFMGTMVDDKIVMKTDVYYMNNMNADLERSLIGTYLKEQPHTGSFQAPIYDAMVNMPLDLVDELNISSNADVALIWANPKEAVRSYFYEVETLDNKAHDSAYIVPIKNDTTVKVYKGEYTGAKDNLAGFSNVSKVYETKLDAGQPLLLNVALPEGMPSYYIEFSTAEGDFALWTVSFPGYSNPFMLMAE